MFNENNIKENRVCYLDGRAQVLSDLLVKYQIKGRKSIKLKELEMAMRYECIEYEKAWNVWADSAFVGGGRYDEKGYQRKVVKNENAN